MGSPVPSTVGHCHWCLCTCVMCRGGGEEESVMYRERGEGGSVMCRERGGGEWESVEV